MNSYGSFAKYYDVLQQDVPYSAIAARIRRLGFEYSSENEVVVELGCGTGRLCRELEKLGFDVIGVDISEDMLEEAEKNCSPESDITYICQDMSSLDLWGAADIIVCVLDGMNHLPNEAAFGDTMERASMFTCDGGLFIFDVNTDSEIATVIESEEDSGTTGEWDTQFVESVHAGTGNYGNSADNINQNLNQNRVVISRGIVSNTRQIWLTGKLSNLDKWLSTNPGQQDDQHNWFALDLVFKKESLDAGLLWCGEYDINDDLLDPPEGSNTLTLWLKLDELATQPKVITIVNKNDPDDVETITIKFINQED